MSILLDYIIIQQKNIENTENMENMENTGTTETVIIKSGSPHELEQEVPSEEIEFPLRVVQSFPTLNALIVDLGCEPGDKQAVEVLEITAETLRDILEFCESDVYQKFLDACKNAPNDIGTDVEKIDDFETLVSEGASLLDEKFGITENPNNDRMIEIYLAAEYLNSRFIKRIGSKLLTPHLIGKTAEEIGKTFNIDLSGVTEDDKAWGRQYLRDNENIDIPEPSEPSAD